MRKGMEYPIGTSDMKIRMTAGVTILIIAVGVPTAIMTAIGILITTGTAVLTGIPAWMIGIPIGKVFLLSYCKRRQKDGSFLPTAGRCRRLFSGGE